MLFRLVRIGLLLASNLQETFPGGKIEVCTADDYMDLMAGMATLLGSLLYAGGTWQSFDVFFCLGWSFVLLFLPQSWFSGKWLCLKGNDPIGDTPIFHFHDGRKGIY